MRAKTTALEPRYASERVRRPPRNFAADGEYAPVRCSSEQGRRRLN